MEHQQTKHEWQRAWHLHFGTCSRGTLPFRLKLLCRVEAWAVMWRGPRGKEQRTLTTTPAELPVITWHQLSVTRAEQFGISRHPSAWPWNKVFPSQNTFDIYTLISVMYSPWHTNSNNRLSRRPLRSICCVPSIHITGLLIPVMQMLWLYISKGFIFSPSHWLKP